MTSWPETSAAGRSAVLRGWLAALRRRLLIALLAFAAVPLIAYVVSRSQEEVYAGSASVLVTFKDPIAADPAGTDPVFNRDDAQRYSLTQANLARTPALAERTVRALHLRESAEDFLARSAAAPRAGTDLLDFTVRDGTRAQAARQAVAYAQQFVRYRARLQQRALDRGVAELGARLRDARARDGRRSALAQDLRARRDRLRALASLPDGGAQVVSRGQRPEQVAPETMRNVVIGIVLGLLLALGLVALLEALDTRTRSGDQVGRVLGLHVLARIPAPGRRSAARSREAEAFRMLRTNLGLASLEHPPRTIVVASALAGEGKSTVLRNLAVAMARAGRHVILADLDLRRPTVAASFGKSATPGATDVIAGAATLDQALTSVPLGERTDVLDELADGRLDLLPAGTTPPDPAELAGTERLADLLAQLAERADIVLVDAPPWLQAPDGLQMSARVDGVLVVARLNHVRRGALAGLRKQLEAAPARKLGLVITGAKDDEDEARHTYGPYALDGDQGWTARPLQDTHR